MLNLDKILEDYSNEVGGKVIPYTDTQSVIVLPTKHGRFQQVKAWSNQTQTYKFLEFYSKVCDLKPEMDLKSLLETASTFVFARIMVKQNQIFVASSVVVDHATPDIIKDMVREVADVADDMEWQLTGQDEN
jgi:hypothetical protein